MAMYRQDLVDSDSIKTSNSDVISFDKAGLEDLISDANYLKNFYNEFVVQVSAQVKVIREKWQGEGSEIAKAQLQKIESSLAVIGENINTCGNAISSVSQNFDAVKYKG